MMPLLVLVLLGMIEFGWGVAQQIDVRHKAREGLRVTIVDESVADIVDRVCTDDIVRAGDITLIAITSGVDVGEPVTLAVTADLQQITGLFGVFWGAAPAITSTVEGRVEQESTFGPPLVLADPCP